MISQVSVLENEGRLKRLSTTDDQKGLLLTNFVLLKNYK